MRFGTIFAWLALLIVVLGCGYVVAISFFGYQVNEKYVQCAWIADGVAFLDRNGNKVHDDGDIPLEGVTFQVDDTYNSYSKVFNGKNVSDAKGHVSIRVRLPGCPKAEFEVYVEPLAGYVLTTDARIKGLDRKDDLYEFGFKEVP